MAESLQEFVDSSGATLRVDRQQGVLRGVKLIGLTSRNGRKYKPEALVGAKPLYEGAKVNVNHPKGSPLSPRDYQDRLGVIREVAFREGEGLFGELHFNPKHPLAEQLIWDAEHNPRNVGVSHNVLARVTKDGDQTLVEAITHVQSVDLVADPAATLGLYEQADRDSLWDTLTIESLQASRPDLVAALQESGQSELREQLAEANEQRNVLERRNRVLKLLSQHGLSLEPEHSKHSSEHESSAASVSVAFYEMLESTADSTLVEQLVRERAELTRSLEIHSARRPVSRPFSRDQLSLQSLPEAMPQSAEEFAKALKVVSA